MLSPSILVLAGMSIKKVVQSDGIVAREEKLCDLCDADNVANIVADLQRINLHAWSKILIGVGTATLPVSVRR